MRNGIKLVVEPRQVYTWDNFVRSKPPYSIALDGIVNGPPARQFSPPYANFDHHGGVDRIATRSTSDQVAMEINMGLFETFQKDGIPTANIYVNDADEDTCLAVWLLCNHGRVTHHAEPAINRLIHCEDRLDTTAGAYPLESPDMRRTMAWIFEPYQEARFRGDLKDCNSVHMDILIQSVMARVTEYSLGRGEQIGLDGKYERIGGGKSWAMVLEKSSAARTAMFNDGIEAFVIRPWSTDKDGHYHYSVGRKSAWIRFPLDKIFIALNDADQDINHANCWGPINDAATTGGSPRATGSSLPPHEVEEIINGVLGKE